MIKIIIADDHKLIRAGLRKLVEHEIDIEVVAETENPNEISEIIKKTDADILLLDLQFPGKSGLDVLKDVKVIKPKLHVLILSMHPEERYAIRALKSGASGYVSKDTDPMLILEAIRKIYSGRKFISPELSEQLLFSMDSNKPLHDYLSDREFQILHLIAKGKSQTKIADDLSLSVSTVNTYRGRILEKLKLKTTSELIHYAIENKLVD
ncbi:MAG: response regulator transcription factor [Ignavibacteriae bacterium]|nr:response regulator transcription factor [Ignavibacteriota bacterium]